MLMKGKLEIDFIQEFKPSKQHSLWYGGRVVEITYAGFTFILGAYGDVIGSLLNGCEELCYVKDKNNYGLFDEIMSEFIPDDRNLRAIEMTEEGKTLVLENNNWWEVLVDTPWGDNLDIGWVCNSDYLSEALQEMIANMDEVIDEIEGGRKCQK